MRVCGGRVLARRRNEHWPTSVRRDCRCHPRTRARPPGAARFVIIEVVAMSGTLPPRGEAAPPHVPLRRSAPRQRVIVHPNRKLIGHC